MTRYLFTTLLVGSLGACSHGNQPSETAANNQQPSDAYSSREGSQEESTAEVTPPQHRARDEMATTGEVPDTTRPVNPATEPAPYGMRPAAPTTPQPDNTGVNERDRGGETLTPMDQSESEEDIRLTQQIRRVIVDNSALSFNAKNIKIITRDGNVTLRGTVASKRERSLIVDAAKAQAGVRQVDDQLEVSTK